MTEKEKIDELVALLDSFVESGGGHMNILLEDERETQELSVEVFQSIDCSKGNMACAVPTLHQGIDDN